MIAIRRVGTEAAESIARLHSACFAQGWDAPSVARLIGGPGGFALIASAEGKDFGFALLQSVPPESELLSIGTIPQTRRKGIGRAMLRQAASDLMTAGNETMFLDVAADNDGAISLYRSLGFGDMSRRPRYYRGTTDAIVMQAGLARIVHG